MSLADENSLVDEWAKGIDKEETENSERRKDTYVRISRYPKHLDARSIASIIKTVTKIVPTKTSIVYAAGDEEYATPIALLKFESYPKMIEALDKLRRSLVSKRWRIELTARPDFTENLNVGAMADEDDDSDVDEGRFYD